MEIVKEEIKDGYKYKTYSNGTVIKQLETAIVNVETKRSPTEDELFRAETLLAQQEIKITQQSQDAVLAEILLSQQTV